TELLIDVGLLATIFRYMR
ncbi:hypothetical protein QE152_g40387, partial [Popillia japonica]